MSNITIWVSIVIISIILAILSYLSAYKKNTFVTKFLEIWRHFLNYFITGVILYYFIVIRWPNINNGLSLSISDFALGVLFILGIFGWIPYFIMNITKGISEIFNKKILNQ